MAGVKWHFVKLKVYLTLSARPQIQKRPRPSQGKGGSLECSTEFLLPSALSNLPTLRRHLRPGRLRGKKDPRKTSHIRQRRVGILRQFSRRSLPCLKQSIGPNIEIRRPSTHPVNPTPMLVAQEEDEGGGFHFMSTPRPRSAPRRAPSRDLSWRSEARP